MPWRYQHSSTFLNTCSSKSCNSSRRLGIFTGCIVHNSGSKACNLSHPSRTGCWTLCFPKTHTLLPLMQMYCFRHQGMRIPSPQQSRVLESDQQEYADGAEQHSSAEHKHCCHLCRCTTFGIRACAFRHLSKAGCWSPTSRIIMTAQPGT